MERDFLGLLTVKEENVGVSADSAMSKESSMQWSFSNNMSCPSQYMSFRASQEDRPRKTVHDQLNESKMFSSSNQTSQSIAITMSPPVVHHSQVSHMSMSPHSVGRVAVPAPVSVLPITSSVIGSTDLKNESKQHSNGPAQLTIFYAGSVNVFDDVSPEKAQAIMLLAGYVPPASNPKTVPKTEVPLPIKKRVMDEGLNGNRTQSPSGFLSLPGAISVTSRAVSPSQGKAICSLELATAKSVGPIESPVINRQDPPKVIPSLLPVITHQDPPKVIHSLVPPSTPLFSTVALPQARKASLARFLEKRKERAMNTTPYPVCSKSPESSISKVSD